MEETRHPRSNFNLRLERLLWAEPSRDQQICSEARRKAERNQDVDFQTSKDEPDILESRRSLLNEHERRHQRGDRSLLSDAKWTRRQGWDDHRIKGCIYSVMSHHYVREHIRKVHMLDFELWAHHRSLLFDSPWDDTWSLILKHHEKWRKRMKSEIGVLTWFWIHHGSVLFCAWWASGESAYCGKNHLCRSYGKFHQS